MTGPAYDLLIFTVLPTRTEPTVEVVTLEVYGSNRKRRVFKLIIVVFRSQGAQDFRHCTRKLISSDLIQNDLADRNHNENIVRCI